MRRVGRSGDGGECGEQGQVEPRAEKERRGCSYARRRQEHEMRKKKPALKAEQGSPTVALRYHTQCQRDMNAALRQRSSRSKIGGIDGWPLVMAVRCRARFGALMKCDDGFAWRNENGFARV